MTDDRFLADFFAFARRPMPTTPEGPFQTGGWLLRFLAWFFAAGLVIGSVGVVANLLAWPFVQGTLPGSGWTRVMAVAVLAWFASLLLMVAVLNWTSWSYARWREADPRGLRHATALGWVLAAFGALQVITAGLEVVQETDAAVPVTGILLGGVALVLGVVLLTVVRRGEVRAAFEDAAPS